VHTTTESSTPSTDLVELASPATHPNPAIALLLAKIAELQREHASAAELQLRLGDALDALQRDTEIVRQLIDVFTEARTRGSPGRRLIVVDNGKQWAAGFGTRALHHADTLYDAVRQAIEIDLP